MKAIDKYQHRPGVHCETGSFRNLLAHAGLEVSEAMLFGTGSGPAFAYLFFAKGPSTFPLVGIRNAPSLIFKNVAKRWGIALYMKQLRTTEAALREANRQIEAGHPVGCCVDMFFMKYLPFFLQVHAPAHFIVLVGREGDRYLVSDPYSQTLGELDAEALRSAWAPSATFSKNNLLIHVKRLPRRSIDWEGAALQAIRETCRTMLLPPLVNKVVFFVGVEGMRAYARAMRGWGRRHKGVILREGILFQAVSFEDQGTGGGAFRIMYGAFLQELSERFGSRGKALRELADQMAEHGQGWRKLSREIIEIGKHVPKREDEFPDWYAANARWLDGALRVASEHFVEKADFEERFFRDLRTVARDLA